MSHFLPTGDTLAGAVARGRYTLFHGGRACGEERWTIATGPGGIVIDGMQELVAPHPLPNRQEYRATLSSEWRPTGIEIRWRVGERLLQATHHAEGGMWRVRIEYAGETKEQEGDFPDRCELEYGSHLFSTVVLARRDFQIGGEHEFPALRIGPPWMAVTPGRLLYRCVERAQRELPFGVVTAKRYIVTAPSEGEEQGYSFWADDEGFVLESYEGLDAERPWMKLVEFERAGDRVGR